MPLYEYHCPKDGTFELVRKFSDPPLEACPTCAGPIEKLVSAPAIQFKGTGWYITDYARKSTCGEAAGNKDAGKKDGAKDKGGIGAAESEGVTAAEPSEAAAPGAHGSTGTVVVTVGGSSPTPPAGPPPAVTAPPAESPAPPIVGEIGPIEVGPIVVTPEPEPAVPGATEDQSL